MVRFTFLTTTTTPGYDYNYFGNETVIDKVPEDIMFMIDPYWYQFPPMDPLWHKLLGIFMFVVGILSFCGNGLVIYIFLATKNLRTPSNLLVINLAFSDFCMMFCMSPAMIYNCIYETWTLGPFACELYAMTGSLFGNTSIWTMVFIALDRYAAIVKGISAKPMTVKTTFYRIIFIWLHGLIWTLFPMWGWNRYVPEGNMTACGTDYLTKSWKMQVVSQHEKNMKEQAKKMNVTSLRSQTGAAKNKNIEIKLAKVALMTISLWFIAWTPYLIINYSGIFEIFTISPLFTIWGSVCAKANAVYNPIVYAISHPKYRSALKQKIPMIVCGRNTELTDMSSNHSEITKTTIKN
ncbi:hypothetical protein PGB90_001306 [Kerria lacca]